MTITLVDAARMLWCPGLVNLTGNHKTSLHDWFAKATYAPANSGNALRLEQIDTRRFLEALSADINRTATAASETLHNIIEIERLPKSLAWPYVKLYYSSFFYAHMLLRIWGRSPSYFRTLELATLRETLAAYSLTAPFAMKTGQFLLIADLGTSAIEIHIDNSSNGTHESVWRALNKALIDLQTAVGASNFLTADKTALITELKSLQSLITNNGNNFSWPSQMRNEIQYRQGEGLWYPYQGKAKMSELRKEILTVFNEETNQSSFSHGSESDLKTFRAACLATIYLARGVIADMREVGGQKNFLNFGQRKFEANLV